ncbi:flavodoxin family protein [Vibrio astriarenae]|uniref:Flavodoxin family protein n=1 Tax=Vibrio astriarenae TaxID=1481923 RepID=A0A7Z2T2L6_9VIBR|nr:NAD(P)H-dependent oxidoreductase [Vibrio astriarenae]QIA63209.1 flavodoxin family protein [Vibrio astriarenae]
MSKVVVISGHPELEKSNTNKIIIDQLGKEIESIDVRRLDTLYPNYQIDVEAEQQALLAADVIVLQFPFYWYSVPALLKKWLDDVFSYNFAYGSKGDKLKGKELITSITIGGPAESYDPLGYNHFTIEQLLHPIQQTAYLAGLNYHAPIYTHGMVYIPGVYNTLEDVEAKAQAHATRVIDKVADLLSSQERQVSALVKAWFENMDNLGEDETPFLSELDENVVFHVPEGEYNGHAGFKDWYRQLRNMFDTASHTLEQVVITPSEVGFKADLRVRLIARTASGEDVNVLVNEEWQLSFKSDQPKIVRYQVDVVTG